VDLRFGHSVTRVPRSPGCEGGSGEAILFIGKGVKCKSLVSTLVKDWGTKAGAFEGYRWHRVRN